MALSNNSRSFTAFGNTTTSDSKSAGSTFNSKLGNASNAWGSNNIWGSGSLTNGFGSRVVTRDNSRSRDGKQQTAGGVSGILEGKRGSGSLVDSSVSNDWNYKTAWGAKTSLPNVRSMSQAKYQEASARPQQRSASNAGPPQTFASSQNMTSLASRPPTINLNNNSAAQSRRSYDSTWTTKGSEPPPNVYTKFDRPSDPSAWKLPDSAKGGLWNDPSPTADRKSHYPLQYSARNGSIPGSRNNSQPPSGQANEQPFFTGPDYSRFSYQSVHNDSRAASISSQGPGPYRSSVDSSANQLASNFSQLSMNGEPRPSTTYKSFAGPNAPLAHVQTSAGPIYSRHAVNGFGSHSNAVDDMDDYDAPAANFQGFERNASPQSTHGYHEFSPAAFGIRSLQRPTGQIPNPPYGIPVGDGLVPDWQTLRAAERNGPGSQDQAAFLDPRMHQLLATQLRTPYSPMYSPYAYTNALQLGAAGSYAPLLHMGVAGVDPATGAADAPVGDNVQSALMYEFKSNTKSKRYELKDIYNHIAEFSGDQHGSRFIQTKLETANSDEKDQVFREIQPNAIQLMTDVFGNYVIQKFFEHGDQTHKKILANTMRGQVLSLSTQMYGCRVVQKALDHVLVDQQALLIGELESHVLKCVKDQNGNHVIQKAIERCPSDTIGFIFAAFHAQVQHLSIHPYGCRVIQRCLERCDQPSKSMVMAELMEGIQSMIADQYGNYVVQHIVEHDDGEGRRMVLDIVGRGLEGYSKHKFASNVVEKCLEKANDQWRREVVFVLASGEQRRCEGEGVLVGLIKDNFGNYVIQKLLDTLSPDDYVHFLDILQPAMSQAKRTGCGKQVLSIEKKMQKFPGFRNVGMGSFYNSGVYQLPAPAPHFTSNFGSAATTPPPLTADTQSRQSSTIASLNGDTVEGATFGSRKGSDPSSNGIYMG